MTAHPKWAEQNPHVAGTVLIRDRRTVGAPAASGVTVSGRGHEALLVAPPGDLGIVHGLLQTLWSHAPGVAARDRLCFETALLELAGNVLEHADDGGGLTCSVHVELCEGRLQALLQDTGRPGDVDLAPGGMPDPLAERGRGIPLIRALVDDLAYERDGDVNRWRISKRLD